MLPLTGIFADTIVKVVPYTLKCYDNSVVNWHHKKGLRYMVMAVEIARKLFTLKEYNHMIEAGVFEGEPRIELIRGEVVEMAALGPKHLVCVARLSRLLSELLGRAAHVWVQSSIQLPPQASSPEPDIFLLKWRDDDYAGKRPAPDDVLLVIEVANTSLDYDRNVKTVLYAEAGIREMWIVNLQEDSVEVYSQPIGGEYKRVHVATRDGELALPAPLSGMLTVDDVLGEQVQWEEE